MSSEVKSKSSAQKHQGNISELGGEDSGTKTC